MQSLKRDLAVGSGISALTLAFALAWGGPFVGTRAAYAEGQSAQTPDPQQQPDHDQKSTTFTGKIVKSEHLYALRDSSGNVYKLDDTARAQRFENKIVKVTGELDEQAMVIHVESIEAAEG